MIRLHWDMEIMKIISRKHFMQTKNLLVLDWRRSSCKLFRDPSQEPSCQVIKSLRNKKHALAFECWQIESNFINRCNVRKVHGWELKMTLKEFRTHISKSIQFDRDPRSSHNLEGRRARVEVISHFAYLHLSVTLVAFPDLSFRGSPSSCVQLRPEIRLHFF